MINVLPPMLAGEELKERLKILPDYNKNIRLESQAVRLMALNDLYKVYLPSAMSCEIYSKIYLAMLRSLQKKGTKLAVQQRIANFKGMKQQNGYTGLIGGSDSFTIIGTSGIGKSSAISRAINIATENRVIVMEEPYCKIIPSVVVQCPFDCSVKSLLLQILRQVDEEIDTHYFDMAVRSKATVDILIGSVSQVALNHIGLLVVDEIQNILNHKQGKSLVGCLTQLINSSGISICMVGTPEAERFFESVDYLARRALGLNYGKYEYNMYFKQVCERLFSYQYVQKETVISDSIIQWLYEHSGGVLAVVVSLIHDAQEISIWNSREQLDLISLNEAYEQRMKMLHTHIQSTVQVKRKTPQTRNNKTALEMVKGCALKENACVEDMQQYDTNKEHFEETGICTSIMDKERSYDWDFMGLAEQAKKEKLDMVQLLKNKVSITEVGV